MGEFRRRVYHNPGALLTDLRSLLSSRGQLRSSLRGQRFAPDFRERLMLVVTAVNGCRYCSYVHAREALAAGVPQQQIEALTAGSLQDAPPHQAPALLYAQHWAEADGRPDEGVRERVARHYGEQQLRRIEALLQIIRVANLLGNTFDYLLHRLSSGRWGGSAAAQR